MFQCKVVFLIPEPAWETSMVPPCAPACRKDEQRNRFWAPLPGTEQRNLPRHLHHPVYPPPHNFWTTISVIIIIIIILYLFLLSSFFFRRTDFSSCNIFKKCSEHVSEIVVFWKLKFHDQKKNAVDNKSTVFYSS